MMKTIGVLYVCILLFAACTCDDIPIPQIQNLSSYQGAYFGQEPPGMEPLLFAPDESYIIFDRHGGSIGFADLFISFKQPNGTWEEAKNMGSPINTRSNETCPYVSPDQQYFFFMRNDQNGELKNFWVDARILYD
ncbi:MAG: hypothetical protein HOG34_22055 [Bacteroidetes bacterium]|jgi:hypothetical protein|nr:hypothetical protein [Bacteroidota bacterium]MBT4398618.1 hypothetical protein [Bacteroidota bacterium]MBT4411394.1 hypothetical protein [Bacteroidota bacterium]MBT7464977.1 hypothetical protein [Bacteroidota bacterium]